MNRLSLFKINVHLNYVVKTVQLAKAARSFQLIRQISIYTVSDLGVLSNLIGSLSLANEHYSPPTK